MNNEFKTCDLCTGFDCEDLVKRLKELDNTANIIVGCQSMCAVGSNGPFVIVNGIPVIGSTNEEVINKIKLLINIK